MRISDWSSDVCSSDLAPARPSPSPCRWARPWTSPPITASRKRAATPSAPGRAGIATACTIWAWPCAGTSATPTPISTCRPPMISSAGAPPLRPACITSARSARHGNSSSEERRVGEEGVSTCRTSRTTAYEMRISDWSSDVCSSDLTMDLSANYGFTETSRHPVGTGSGGNSDGLHHLGMAMRWDVGDADADIDLSATYDFERRGAAASDRLHHVGTVSLALNF